jgi:hypothetical protein
MDGKPAQETGIHPNNAPLTFVSVTDPGGIIVCRKMYQSK